MLTARPSPKRSAPANRTPVRRTPRRPTGKCKPPDVARRPSETAVSTARGEFVALVEEHREGLRRTLEKATADQREAYGRALEALATQHRELTEALGSEAWLRDFPSGRYVPGKFGAVPSLTARSGDPQSFEAVVEALRELAEPKARREGAMPPQSGAQPLREVPRAA